MIVLFSAQNSPKLFKVLVAEEDLTFDFLLLKKKMGNRHGVRGGGLNKKLRSQKGIVMRGKRHRKEWQLQAQHHHYNLMLLK